MSDEPATESEAEPKSEAQAEPSASPDAVAAKDEPRKKKRKPKIDPSTDARVAQIAAAFDAGNFQRVRELANELAKSGSPTLQDIANDYATRIAVDPVQIAFLGLCAIALLTIAWIYVPH